MYFFIIFAPPRRHGAAIVEKSFRRLFDGFVTVFRWFCPRQFDTHIGKSVSWRFCSRFGPGVIAARDVSSIRDTLRRHQKTGVSNVSIRDAPSDYRYCKRRVASMFCKRGVDGGSVSRRTWRVYSASRPRGVCVFVVVVVVVACDERVGVLVLALVVSGPSASGAGGGQLDLVPSSRQFLRASRGRFWCVRGWPRCHFRCFRRASSFFLTVTPTRAREHAAALTQARGPACQARPVGCAFAGWAVSTRSAPSLRAVFEPQQRLSGCPSARRDLSLTVTSRCPGRGAGRARV